MDLAKLISSIPMKQYCYSSEDVSLGIMAEHLGDVKLTMSWWWDFMWSKHGPTVWLPSEANYFLNFVTGEIPAFGQITTAAGSGLSEELQLFMWELHQCYLNENHLLASESGCIAVVDEMRRLRDLWQKCERERSSTVECRQPLMLNATFVNTLQTSLAPYKAVVTMHRSGNEARQQTSIMKKRVL